MKKPYKCINNIFIKVIRNNKNNYYRHMKKFFIYLFYANYRKKNFLYLILEFLNQVFSSFKHFHSFKKEKEKKYL